MVFDTTAAEFILPVVVSFVITVCLAVAARLSGKRV
jgi:hypothetical protein